MWIKVEFQDVRGKKKTKKFKDWEARIFQHEYDHLDGVLYVDRLTPEGRTEVRTPSSAQQTIRVGGDICTRLRDQLAYAAVNAFVTYCCLLLLQVQGVLDKLVTDFGPGGAL